MARMYWQLSALPLTDALDEIVSQYAYVYIFFLLDGKLLADTCENVVHINLLNYLIDI